MTTPSERRRKRRRHPANIGSAPGPVFGADPPDAAESVEAEFDEAPIDDLVRQAARGSIDVSDL